jgi:hypothetical protein
MKLPPTLRASLDHSQRIFRKNFIQQNAVMLQVYLRALVQSEKYAAVRPLIDKLDIRADDVTKATKNDNPSFYADAYSAVLDTKLRDAYAWLEKAQGLGNEFKEMNTFYRSAITNPYMHLGRKGDFFVEFDIAKTPEAHGLIRAAMEPYGKVIGNPGATTRHVFMRFENFNQMLAAREKIDALGTAAEAANSGSLLNRSEFELAAGVPQFAKRLLGSVDSAFEGLDLAPEQLASIRDYIKRQALDAIPDTSARKATLKRRDGSVKGYDADFLRNYAVRAEGMASMLANGYTMHQYDGAFRSMKDAMTKMGDTSGADAAHARDIYAELARRFSNTMSPVNSPVVDGLKAFGYNFYLAFSPAFYLVNMMQPYHLTLPVLGGRYGYVRSAKEMALATGKAIRIVASTLKQGAAEGSGAWGTAVGMLDARLKFDTAGLSAHEKHFVERLLASGQLDTTQSYSLGRLAAGSSAGWSNTMKFIAAGSHYTEVVNRLTAGLAGFNLEMKAGKNFEKAASRGIDDAVRGTQYDYSDHNTASALGRHGWAGPVTPLMSSFQNYSLQTSELLLRLVRDAAFRAPEGSTPQDLARFSEERKVALKTLGGVMGTTSLLAGTLGLPMASVITRLADSILSTDDDPVDSKHAFRRWLADSIGEVPAELMARGVPRTLLGVDFSSRAGLQDILPGTRFLTDLRKVEDVLQTGALNLMGPAMGGAVKDMTVGISHMLDGRVMDGLTEAMPLALRGPAKAVKMSQRGFTTSTGIRLPMEVTPGALAAQSMGFTPSVKAEQAEVNFRMRTRDMLLKREQARIRSQVVKEFEQDGAISTDTLIRLQDWNMKNPQQAIDPKTTLLSRAKMRAVAEYSGTGIATLPKYLPMLEDYNYAVTQ